MLIINVNIQYENKLWLPVWRKFQCTVQVSLQCVFLNASNFVPVMEQRRTERSTAESEEPEVQHSSDNKDAAILQNGEIYRRTSLTGCAPLALRLTNWVEC